MRISLYLPDRLRPKLTDIVWTGFSRRHINSTIVVENTDRCKQNKRFSAENKNAAVFFTHRCGQTLTASWSNGRCQKIKATAKIKCSNYEFTFSVTSVRAYGSRLCLRKMIQQNSVETTEKFNCPFLSAVSIIKY